MNRPNPVVLIMAGGTGGHVFPAMATAEILRSKGCSVEWLGTSAGIEARVVPEASINLNLISIQGIRGKGKLSLLLAPFKLFRAILQALAVVKRVKPDAVLGMGGFASGPGAIAAWIKKTPLVIHEQNAIAGLTNTQSRRFAKRVLQAFPNAFKSGAQGEVVGNPIRGPILDLAAPERRFVDRIGPIRVLVVGGSLGAKAINQLIPNLLAEFEGQIEIWHQAGKFDFERTKSDYEKLNKQARVEPFIEQMDQAYEWADVVICRAGALTVSELAIAGIGALLVPFPFAVDDHQTANGQFLVEAGAAQLIQQRNLTIDRLNDWMRSHLNREQLLKMAQNARFVGRPDAGERVANACMEVCQ